MITDNMQIKFGEAWTCGSWDEHANEQTQCHASRHGWRARHTQQSIITLWKRVS